MSQTDIFLGISFIIAWTGTVIGVMLWLNKSFRDLSEKMERVVPSDIYETRHHELDDRVKRLELWQASMRGDCFQKMTPRAGGG